MLVQYSTNTGFSWYTLRTLCRSCSSSSFYQVIQLPTRARSPHTRFRWIQPYNRGSGYAQWSIDDVIITGQQNLTDSVYVDFSSAASTYLLAGVIGGGMPSAGYCSKTSALVFSGTGSSLRYVMTQDLDLSKASASQAVVQFELVMGCGSSFGTSGSYNVVLQYSTNSGSSWTQVAPYCSYTDSTCSKGPGSSYDWKMFSSWRRATVRLPSGALKSTVRFRWTQTSFSSSTTWALRNIVVTGSGCPTGCSNRGQCMPSGSCACDAGYTGPSCLPVSPLPTMLHDSFDTSPVSSQNWLLTAGGSIGTGCYTLAQGSTLYFSQSIVRMAITRDLDTRDAT